MTNEQWKDKGKCYECRRNGYCNKPCKAYKERAEYEFKCFIARKMFQSMNKKESE